MKRSLIAVLVALSIAVGTLGPPHAQATDPQDYFVPPGGRIIEMPPLTWQEKEIWDKALSREPPDCGGACHRPLGLPEDEPFLRASAKFVLALANFRDSQRRMQDCQLKEQAEGRSGSQFSGRCYSDGTVYAGALSYEQQAYGAAFQEYLSRLAPRGIGGARIIYLERTHRLSIQ